MLTFATLTQKSPFDRQDPTGLRNIHPERTIRSEPAKNYSTPPLPGHIGSAAGPSRRYREKTASLRPAVALAVAYFLFSFLLMSATQRARSCVFFSINNYAKKPAHSHNIYRGLLPTWVGKEAGDAHWRYYTFQANPFQLPPTSL